MKKGRNRLVVLLTLLICMGMTAQAADAPDATVTFDGSRTLQYSGFEEDGGFGSAFQGMLPGEERTVKIRLQNTSDRNVDFFMDTQILKSLQEASDNAAYYVKLEVLQDGASTVILGSGEEAAVVGGTSSAETESRGLKELNDTLNGYRMVASLDEGGTAEIRLDIQLDGETGDNSYQNQIGVMQFQFQASYNEPEVQTVERTRKGDTQVQVQIIGQPDGQIAGLLTTLAGVQTGDDAPIAALIAAVCAASAGLIVLIMLARRSRKQEDAA